VNSVVLKRSAIDEWGIYVEAGAIVLGFKYLNGAPIQSLIVQIEENSSGLVEDELSGMYVEIDEMARFYRAVREFKYDEASGCIRLALNPGAYKDVGVLQIEVPNQLCADEQQLLRKLAAAYDSSLRRRN